MTGLELSVLGPVRVSRDGEEVDLGTPRQRAIIAALALAHGRPVPSSAVIERVCGDTRGRRWSGTNVSSSRAAPRPASNRDSSRPVVGTSSEYASDCVTRTVAGARGAGSVSRSAAV